MPGTPIEEAGYEQIRQLINADLVAPNQWQYLEAQEDDGTIVWRGSTAGDWNTTATDQVQTVEVTISGQDVIDFMGGDPLPVTVETSILKNADADAADELAVDSFEEATLADTDDALVVTHEVEVPEV